MYTLGCLQHLVPGDLGPDIFPPKFLCGQCAQCPLFINCITKLDIGILLQICKFWAVQNPRLQAAENLSEKLHYTTISLLLRFRMSLTIVGQFLLIRISLPVHWSKENRTAKTMTFENLNGGGCLFQYCQYFEFSLPFLLAIFMITSEELKVCVIKFLHQQAGLSRQCQWWQGSSFWCILLFSSR